MARISGTTQPPRYTAERFVAFWKPEAHRWVTDFFTQHTYKNGMVVKALAVLEHTMPHLLIDAAGRKVTYKQFYGLVQMVRKELNGSATPPAPAPKPKPQPAPQAAGPTPKLVPVDTRAIIAENNDLRKTLGSVTQIVDNALSVMHEATALLAAVAHGPNPTAAKERLALLADLVQQK